MSAAAPASRPFALEALAAAAVVLAVHLIFRLSEGFLVGALNDDGVYVVLGKAVAEGQGYRSIHLVGGPVQLRYPPGLPLVLAIPWSLAGTLGAVRATVAVLHPLITAAAAGLIWWLGRRRLEVSPLPLALLAGGPFLIDPTIQYFNIPLAEPYLVLGWAGALALAYPLLAAGSPPQPWRAAGVGLVLAAATLFRSAGSALLPAMLLALVLHRRWKDAAWCAAALAVPLLGWEGLRAAWAAGGPVSPYPDDLGYFRWLGIDRPGVLAAYLARAGSTNAVEYVGKLASYLFSSQPLGVLVVLGAALGAGLTGVRAWRDHTALAITALASLALTLVWPFAQGRLILPLLPFFGLLAAAALERGIRATPARYRWGPPVALGLLAVAMGWRQVELRAAAARAFQAGGTPRPQDLSPTLALAARSSFIRLTTTWVAEHTAPGDAIMSDASASVYLYTGRPAVAGLPTESRVAGASVFATPGAYLARRIIDDGVALVVYAPPAGALERDILTVIERCPGVLRREPPGYPAFFRVVARDTTCLGPLARGASTR